MAARGQTTRRSFGRIRRLPSKRWQAGYSGPDARVHLAPVTFTYKPDAEGWLRDERRLIEIGEWTPPEERETARRHQAEASVTFGDYARAWLDSRRVKGQPLRPSTRAAYDASLRIYLLPRLAAVPLKDLTPATVRDWYSEQASSPTRSREKAYATLRAICQTAFEEGVLHANPCRIRGAGSSQPPKPVVPLTPDQIESLAAHMPSTLRLMVLIGGWCGLRYGELAELRRKDIDVRSRLVKIRRTVSWVTGQTIVSATKTSAGVRDVAVPKTLLTEIQHHLGDHVDPGPESLLFPSSKLGQQIRHSVFRKALRRAGAAIGRPEATPHLLRHSAATLAAQTGATVAELQARLGHATPDAAMRYQHARQERDRALAGRLDKTRKHISKPDKLQ